MGYTTRTYANVFTGSEKDTPIVVRAARPRSGVPGEAYIVLDIGDASLFVTDPDVLIVLSVRAEQAAADLRAVITAEKGA